MRHYKYTTFYINIFNNNEFQTINEEITFKKNISSGDGNNDIITYADYDDFAEEVFRLYNEEVDYRELIAQLIYADIELSDVLDYSPDNRHYIKASRLVKKILNYIEFELKYQTLTIRDRQIKGNQVSTTYKWTADDVHFVELVYGLIESKSVEKENGKAKIKEFAEHLGEFLGIELRDSHDTYSSTIKRRNKDDRAYFLNSLVYILNKKMNHEDDMPPPALPAGHTRTLFDDM